MKASDTPKRCDIFLSHNRKDRPLVREVAEGLELEFGVSHFLDEYAIPVGEEFLPWVEHAIESSKGCAIFLGQNGWGPTHLWEAEKALARFNRDPDFRLIPVIFDSAKQEDLNRLGNGAVFAKLNWVQIPAGPPTVETIDQLRKALSGEPAEPNRGPARLTPYMIRREAFRWWQRKDSSVLYRGRQLRDAQTIAIEAPALVVGKEVTAFLAASSRATIRRKIQLSTLSAAIIGATGVFAAIVLRAPSWAWIPLGVRSENVWHASLYGLTLRLKLEYFENRIESEIELGPRQFFLNLEIDRNNDVIGCIAYSENPLNGELEQTVGCEAFESGAGSLSYLQEKVRNHYLTDLERARDWPDSTTTHSLGGDFPAQTSAKCDVDLPKPFDCRISKDGKTWIATGPPNPDFKPVRFEIEWVSEPEFTLFVAGDDRKEEREDEYSRGGLYRWREGKGWDELDEKMGDWHDFRQVIATKQADGTTQLSVTAGHRNRLDSGPIPANVPGIFVSRDLGDSWDPLSAGWITGIGTTVHVYWVFPTGEMLASKDGQVLFWRKLSIEERFRLPMANAGTVNVAMRSEPRPARAPDPAVGSTDSVNLAPEAGDGHLLNARAPEAAYRAEGKKGTENDPTDAIQEVESPRSEHIQKQIFGVVAEQLGIRLDAIELNANLVDDLGADSLDLVEIRMAVEEEFDFPLTDKECLPIKTVGEIVDLVANRLPVKK